MKLNARDEVVAEGSKITVNGAAVKVSVFHGYALRGTPTVRPVVVYVHPCLQIDFRHCGHYNRFYLLNWAHSMGP